MDIASFLSEHQLPETYRQTAQNWFIPLADEIKSHCSGARRPFFVGVNGCQGSGKSTLCDFLVFYLGQAHGLNVVTVSLDDFYLPKSDRNALAIKVHPLLATRGVPGTHNTPLALATLARLREYGTVSLPRFNKATDDPRPVTEWPVINSPPDIVLIEGWCWGVPPQLEQELDTPVNELEANEDPLGTWRRFVNSQLAGDYQTLFSQMQYWVMLKGPSFDHVYRWRCEQEHKLLAKQGPAGSGIMTDEQIARFIQHYQRLTEHGFTTLPGRCNHVFELDENRHIAKVVKQPL
ncbi:kinase [Alteromonas aestuariivivens]|uniref:Kinase n=1 Tax=Alteromonas aestuariivivens TaxID=1938339 RepID=A0A3D8MBC9_9ALTE|nr:kinase [Alteromonas aestuariivivens]RDV27336.1 kinase [Alteromonas aestuariivivens]